MNAFANAIQNEAKTTYTENGMKAMNTTDSACLDLFAVIGALRQTNYGRTNLQTDRAERLFADAYNENPLLATKTLFYARDIREGLGERDTVRNLMRYTAKYHPEALKSNLDLVGFYGRYDDLYSFIGTSLEDEMWNCMKAQFELDIQNMETNKPVSLLAKWIKTPDASSKKTRSLGILTAKKLGYSTYEFKRILRKLRKHIGIVESQMSANEWNDIQYPSVPSRAAMLYRNAFKKHDGDRYDAYIQSAIKGEAKINSGTLYPYDLVEKFWEREDDGADTLEAQWRQLPNYVGEGHNILVMADVSGSMSGRPMASSIGLAMYFAERNVGDFHNLFMTFSSHPDFVKLKGETLQQKIQMVHGCDWGMDTNIEAAFDSILNLCKSHNIKPEEVPEAIIIVTDMEFNEAASESYNGVNWNFYKEMETRFQNAGYKIPHIVFWNVRSGQDTFHASSDYRGVTMVSGHATSSFKAVVKCLNMTPYEMMLEVLNSERYAPITIEG